MQRCYKADNEHYENYGARGITVSEEFHDKVVFVGYLKSLPTFDLQKSIERIDNNKGYERGNIIFATHLEQCANTRKTTRVFWNGKYWSAKSWALTFSKFSPGAVARMLRRGVTPEAILAREHDDNPGFRPRKRRPSTPVFDGSISSQ